MSKFRHKSVVPWIWCLNKFHWGMYFEQILSLSHFPLTEDFWYLQGNIVLGLRACSLMIGFNPLTVKSWHHQDRLAHRWTLALQRAFFVLCRCCPQQ